MGYADFINGFYDVEVGMIHDEHPVYRKTTTTPTATNSSLEHYLYLYYHAQQEAWAIAQNVGSNGVIAYAPSAAATAESLKGAIWKVANRYQEFIDDDQVTCCKFNNSRSYFLLILCI